MYDQNEVTLYELRPHHIYQKYPEYYIERYLRSEKPYLFEGDFQEARMVAEIERIPVHKIRYEEGRVSRTIRIAMEPRLSELLEAPIKAKFESDTRRLEKELATKDEQIKLFEERISLFNSLPWYRKIWFVLAHGL